LVASVAGLRWDLQSPARGQASARSYAPSRVPSNRCPLLRAQVWKLGSDFVRPVWERLDGTRRELRVLSRSS